MTTTARVRAMSAELLSRRQMPLALHPMLTVSNAEGASDFYRRAFDAVEVSRQKAPTGQLVMEMRIEDEVFFVVDENRAAFNVSPTSLDGTTVRLSLIVDDPDAAAAKAVAAGATVVFPVSDQPYGMRQGRIQDPYGHHWLIGKMLQK